MQQNSDIGQGIEISKNQGESEFTWTLFRRPLLYPTELPDHVKWTPKIYR